MSMLLVLLLVVLIMEDLLHLSFRAKEMFSKDSNRGDYETLA